MYCLLQHYCNVTVSSYCKAAAHPEIAQECFLSSPFFLFCKSLVHSWYWQPGGLPDVEVAGLVEAHLLVRTRPTHPHHIKASSVPQLPSPARTLSQTC